MIMEDERKMVAFYWSKKNNNRTIIYIKQYSVLNTDFVDGVATIAYNMPGIFSTENIRQQRGNKAIDIKFFRMRLLVIYVFYFKCEDISQLYNCM